MKLIHCADIHLDSKMTSNLSKEKAKERKNEILITFLDMIRYAASEGVSAIIIAGDLFDTNSFSATTKNAVISAFRDNPEIDFYYIKGNHGGGDRFIEGMDEIPGNLHLFGESWTTYVLGENGSGRITLSGIELSRSNYRTAYSLLNLDPADYNIVTLHGQTGTYSQDGSPEVIGLNELKNKSIDYLALGHVHEYYEGDLLPRGRYCYPGCLEGRGFDECGEHGFVVLDIDDADYTKVKRELMDFSKRHMFELHTDISDCENSTEILDKIKETAHAAGCVDRDLIKAVLEGNVSADCEKSTEYLEAELGRDFYFAKVYDRSKLFVDYNDYELDASLKGEFVRLVKNDETLSDDEKAQIIVFGLAALRGEDIQA